MLWKQMLWKETSARKSEFKGDVFEGDVRKKSWLRIRFLLDVMFAGRVAGIKDFCEGGVCERNIYRRAVCGKGVCGENICRKVDGMRSACKWNFGEQEVCWKDV